MSFEVLAAVMAAAGGVADMREFPACHQLAGMCGAALVDAGHVHYCGMGVTHASPDFRSPSHRCVCGRAWTENTDAGVSSP